MSKKSASTSSAQDRPRAAAERKLIGWRACKDGVDGSGWPIARIDEVVLPGKEQRAAFDELRSATEKAASIVRAPVRQKRPTGRLAAMEQRIDALLKAIGTLRPALAKFHAGLSDEQKSRLNRILADGRRSSS
jgi:LTXXQ motif family protein